MDKVVFDSDKLTKCICGGEVLTIEQWNLTQHRVPELVLVRCPNCGRHSHGRYWHTIVDDWNELATA